MKSEKNFSKNPNTVKSTSFVLNVWETWCKQQNIVNNIEENEPEKLNKLLETFYAEVKNKNSDDYEPDSLRVMIAALGRHLNEKGYKFFIIREREFHSSKQVLEGKAWRLRQSGMGKRPNKARSLTEEEEEVLWEREKFGSKTPGALISSTWWLLTQFFGFQLCKNDEGMEFMQFTQGPTKTRQGGHAEQEQRFSATNVLCWRRKESGCSLQTVCRGKTTKHAMVRSFLPQYQKQKTKTE